MKPVFQSTDNDCFRACVASITEIPVEQIPNIAHSDNWFGEMVEFLGHYNWMTVAFKTLEIHGGLDGCHCIVTGKSPRGGFNHATVGKIKTIHNSKEKTLRHEIQHVHDPHKSDKGIEDFYDMIVLFRRV